MNPFAKSPVRRVTLENLHEFKPYLKGESTVPKNNKTPKWVLLDQIHVDIHIQADMPAKDRNELRKVCDRLVEGVIMGGDKRVKVKITR